MIRKHSRIIYCRKGLVCDYIDCFLVTKCIMRDYVYVFECVYDVCICACIHMRCMHVCARACVYLCARACVYLCARACVYVYACICLDVCLYVCVYLYSQYLLSSPYESYQYFTISTLFHLLPSSDDCVS